MRLLTLNVHIEVFVGGAAAISFLQTVRQVVVRQIGPSPFSHNDGMETMLEAESPEARRSISSDEAVDLGSQQRLDYLKCYYTIVREPTRSNMNITKYRATDGRSHQHSRL